MTWLLLRYLYSVTKAEYEATTYCAPFPDVLTWCFARALGGHER